MNKITRWNKAFLTKRDFYEFSSKKLGDSAEDTELKRFIEASKQRIRRAIYQSLNHLASLDLLIFKPEVRKLCF